MLPPVLFTVITPSATVHSAGDLSFTETHSSTFLPSNNTTASEGGVPVFTGPGVTTFGTGSQISVSSGFGAGAAGVCANKGAATASRAAEVSNVEIGIRIMQRKYTA
jgi:hypothetical protein